MHRSSQSEGRGSRVKHELKIRCRGLPINTMRMVPVPCAAGRVRQDCRSGTGEEFSTVHRTLLGRIAGNAAGRVMRSSRANLMPAARATPIEERSTIRRCPGARLVEFPYALSSAGGAAAPLCRVIRATPQRLLATLELTGDLEMPRRMGRLLDATTESTRSTCRTPGTDSCPRPYSTCVLHV